MPAALKRLLVTIAALGVAIAVAAFAEHDGLGAVVAISTVFIGLPVIVASTIDLVTDLRDGRLAGRSWRFCAHLAAVPVGLFGLASILIGLGIIAWVVYNLFDPQPEYTGAALLPSFGLAPLFLLFGFHTLRVALTGGDAEAQGAGQGEPAGREALDDHFDSETDDLVA